LKSLDGVEQELVSLVSRLVEFQQNFEADNVGAETDSNLFDRHRETPRRRRYPRLDILGQSPGKLTVRAGGGISRISSGNTVKRDLHLWHSNVIARISSNPTTIFRSKVTLRGVYHEGRPCGRLRQAQNKLTTLVFFDHRRKGVGSVFARRHLHG